LFNCSGLFSPVSSFQGKGYPDLCTRAFLHLLYETALKNANPQSPLGGGGGIVTPSCAPPCPPPRFYALVDSDPDGMAIMSTYKYGSKAHAHESFRLNAPNLQWLGVRISDVVASAGSTLGGEDDPLIHLTSRDRKKALAMLRNSPAFAEDGPEVDWRAELQTMLMLNLKAETEILYERGGGLEGWLDRKMV
jgi:meiotic recombination protein SPO11